MSIELKTSQKDLRRLQRTLKTLPDKVLKKVVNPSMRAAARPVVNAARATVPRRTGQLRKSIGVRLRTYGRDRKVWVGIGPRSGFKKDGVNPTQYAHLVEFGTSRTEAKPFLRPALASTAGQQLSRFNAKARQQFGKLNIKER